MRRVIARCGICHAPAVSIDRRPALIFHAAGCPERHESQREDRCQDPECWKVLDPARVERHGAKTCDDKCRAAAWKDRTGYGRPPARPRASSPSPSGDGPARQGGRTNGRKKPSGIQISYRKAVGVLARALVRAGAVEPLTIVCATEHAERLLREVLSEKQRARLEARKP